MVSYLEVPICSLHQPSKMPEHSVKDEINSATSSEAISIARANSTSNPVSDEESSATEISEGHHSTESEEVAFGDDRLE